MVLAEIAREAAGPERFVAGSIGPTGFLPASDDPTLGDISFARLAEVARTLCLVERDARGDVLRSLELVSRDLGGWVPTPEHPPHAGRHRLTPVRPRP